MSIPSTAKSDSTYDGIPYPGFTFSQTHPDLLATMGRLHGLSTADPRACRVLEAGCGTGANLLLMAHTLPESEFVGIDLSAVQIDIAKTGASELGLKNVSFEQRDILGVDPQQLGRFDYIIAHGIFSWVPADVRQALIDIYSGCLSENGVGFISFNSYPGCHLRQMAWEPMRFHVSGIDSGPKKVEEGKKLLAALANAAAPDSIYRSILWDELKRLVEKPLAASFHDDFESTNQPYYFHEFSSAMRSSGLKYLTEAEPQWLNFADLPPNAQTFLHSLDSDIEKREQYLDFVRCTRFRNVLVCNENAKTTHVPDVTAVKDFFVAAEIAPVSDDEKVGNYEAKNFSRPDGASLGIGHPLTKAALVHLGNVFPRRIRFDELVLAAEALLETSSSADDIATLVKCLSDMTVVGYVRLHSYEPVCSYTLSERPIANEFTAWQARSDSDSIALFNHITLHPEIDITRDLIPLLDGTKDHTDLVSAMNKRLSDTTKERIAASGKNMDDLVNENLKALANGGALKS